MNALRSLAESGLDRDMRFNISNTLCEHIGLVSTAAVPCDLAAALLELPAEAKQVGLQRQIVWLDGLLRSTGNEQVAGSHLQPSDKGFQRAWDNEMGCRVTYKPVVLLQCVALPFNLQSSEAAPEVINASLQRLPDFEKNP